MSRARSGVYNLLDLLQLGESAAVKIERNIATKSKVWLESRSSESVREPRMALERVCAFYASTLITTSVASSSGMLFSE